DLALYDGAAGVAWAAAHLAHRLPAADRDARLDRFDRRVERALRAHRGHRDYDLVSGWVGLGVYALERLPRPGARRCLARVVELLDTAAERTPAGVTWRTAPALLPAPQRREYPDGYYNLGLAHGVAGAIGLLAAALAANVARRTARTLLDGAVPWL